jgi:hypothetical protein
VLYPLDAFGGVTVIKHYRILRGIAWNINLLRHPLRPTGKKFHQTTERFRGPEREVEVSYLPTER